MNANTHRTCTNACTDLHGIPRYIQMPASIISQFDKIVFGSARTTSSYHAKLHSLSGTLTARQTDHVIISSCNSPCHTHWILCARVWLVLMAMAQDSAHLAFLHIPSSMPTALEDFMTLGIFCRMTLRQGRKSCECLAHTR
jgi:hypothetical protein